MRTEAEILEAHGFVKAAYDSAIAEGCEAEADKYAWMCHALAWALGYGKIFENVVEVGRKTQDDAELSVRILERNDQRC